MTQVLARQADRSTSKHVPTILCIDDDPDVSGAIELHMRSFDVKVVRAFHGMHGFDQAIREHPDLIIMDIAMPSGDGGTIMEWLRRNRQTAHIPVIILTGMRDRRLMQKLLGLGANRFVRKPAHLAELVREIGRFVELRPRRDEEA